MSEDPQAPLEEPECFSEQDDGAWVPEWWEWVEPELDVDGDEPPAEWEAQLGLALPHYWYRFRCLTCESYPLDWRDLYCEACREEVHLCVRCKTRQTNYSGDICDACWEETLCRICGVKPRVSGHRCDTCRKYFERNGRERPGYLIERKTGRSWREIRKAQGSVTSTQ